MKLVLPPRCPTRIIFFSLLFTARCSRTSVRVLPKLLILRCLILFDLYHTTLLPLFCNTRCCRFNSIQTAVRLLGLHAGRKGPGRGRHPTSAGEGHEERGHFLDEGREWQAGAVGARVIATNDEDEDFVGLSLGGRVVGWFDLFRLGGALKSESEDNYNFLLYLSRISVWHSTAAQDMMWRCPHCLAVLVAKSVVPYCRQQFDR